MKDDQHKRKHHAITVAQALVGKLLDESWMYAKSRGLRVKVRTLDNEQIRRDNHDDDTHISVVVIEGRIKKAWVG